jgi:T-complex protein 1 subunit delta
MDKMIRNERGEVTITNDGATILKQMQVKHPAAKMLVEISNAQDIEAGDGTTSVVVFAGALLSSALTLLEKGIHPTVITDGYQFAMEEAQKILLDVEKPISLDDKEGLIQNAITSLSSKVVSNYSQVLAPIAVEAVLRPKRY